MGCGGGGGSGVAPPPPANTAPTADAGTDRIANERDSVALSRAARDSDGTIASYRWQQISGPNVTLADADAADTEFTAPAWASDESALVFRLTVTDDDGATGSDPEFLIDVHCGRDDYALIPDGGTRDIGGNVSVRVTKNADGGYEVTVSRGRVAEFERWCEKIWFTENEYDTGCFLDEAERE